MLIKKEEKMMIKRKKKGFTLIELIVVIAILGILAAIAVPRLGGFRADAQLKADNATAATVGKAAEAYMATLPAVPADGTTYTKTELATYVDGDTADLLDGTKITVTVTGGNVTVVGPNHGKYPLK